MKNQKSFSIGFFAVIISLMISLQSVPVLVNAYWGELAHTNLFKQTGLSAAIGSWQFEETPTIPDGVIIVDEGEIHPGKDHPVYYDNELVYLLSWRTHEFLGKTDINAPSGTYFFGWRWYPYLLYNDNHAVIYNGRLYLGLDVWNISGAANNPETARAWDVVGSVGWISGKIYRTTGTVVEYNGELYKTTQYINNPLLPPNQSSEYTRLTNTAYVAGKTYNAGDVIRYNGGVYIAEKTMARAPETVKGDWKRLDSPIYSPYQTYKLHDPVEYNGHYYQVVNAALANSSAPGEVSYAWNQIDTYQYNSKNVYKLNHLVIYNNRVYRSLKNDNISPISDTSAWVTYNFT